MKRIFTLLLAGMLWLPTTTRAQDAEALGALVGVLKDVDDPAFQLDILRGIADALKGQRNVKAPKGWEDVAGKLAKSPNADVRRLSQELSLVFGSKAALEALRKVLVDSKAKLVDRRKALDALVSARDKALPPVLRKLLPDTKLRGEALRGLGAFNDERTPPAILSIYPKLTIAEKRDALMTLSSRKGFARALLEAVAAKNVPARDLSAEVVRQLRGYNDKEMNARVEKLWGVSRKSSDDILMEIERLKKVVEKSTRKPDLARGRMLYQRTCAQCHKLFGEGGEIGPDITGSNRGNLDYLLTNILDPNAEIPNDYRTTNIETKDELSLTGIIKRDEGTSVTLQAANQLITIPRADIASMRQGTISMMPVGLVAALKEEELLDLIAYLRGKGIVALPKK